MSFSLSFPASDPERDGESTTYERITDLIPSAPRTMSASAFVPSENLMPTLEYCEDSDTLVHRLVKCVFSGRIRCASASIKTGRYKAIDVSSGPEGY